MEKEKMWVTVYRDRIEEYDENWEVNLASVLTTKDFVEKYLEECHNGEFNGLEDFLNEYLADDTDDFYEYAVNHNAVIEVENW